MGLTDWMGSFERARTSDVALQLERAYESALLIQSLELEYYNDRPVRPELELSIPRAAQAQMLRRFRAALQVCRTTLSEIERFRAELDSQELRQLQLIETTVSRYGQDGRLPAISRSPEMLPRSILGVFDGVRRQLDPEAEASMLAGFRRRRDSTLVSLRILLLLVLVPLIVQQMSRTVVISPLVDRLAPEVAFLNYPKPHLQEKAVNKLRLYQEELEFQALLEGKEPLSRDDLHTALAEKAADLKEEADGEGLEATKNILADARASLMLDERKLGDPLEGARVMLMGSAAKTESADARRRYLAYQPEAEMFADFGDFAFYEIRLKGAHLVAGFGRIVDLQPADILTDLAGAETMVEAEPEVIAHMNADHADALALGDSSSQTLTIRNIGLAPLTLDGLDLTGTSAFTVADMAADAIALCDAIGISSAHVMGFSMGGAIAQELAIARPDLARSLVLVGTWAYSDRMFRNFIESSIYFAGLADDGEKFLMYFLGSTSGTSRRHRRVQIGRAHV